MKNTLIAVFGFFFWAFTQSVGLAAECDGKEFLDNPNASRKQNQVERILSQINDQQLGNGYSEDVYDKMKQRLRNNDPMPANEMFALLAEERNREECQCKPGLIKSAIVYGLNGLNMALRKAFGGAITIPSLLRRRFGNEFTKAGGDAEVVFSTINRERNYFIDALETSIQTDVRYAVVYRELFYLLRSTPSEEVAKSNVIKLVIAQDELTEQLLKKFQRKFELDRYGKSQARGGEYSRLLIEIRTIDALRLKAKKELRGLMQSNQSLTQKNEIEQFEFEVLSRWEQREKLKVDSQYALASLFVAAEKMRILDTMLEGDLNGLKGPIDSQRLEKLANLMEKERDFLSNSSVFGDFFTKNSDIVVLADKQVSGYERFRAVRHISDRWLSLWGPRLEMIRPKIQFDFALSNLTLEAIRFIANNNLRAQRNNVMRGLRWLGLGIKKIGSATPIVGKLFTRADMSEKERVELDEVLLAFQIIVEHARDGSGGVLDDQTLRDEMSIVHRYLVKLSDQGKVLPEELVSEFAHAGAMNVFEWMYARAMMTNGAPKPYNTLIAREILKVQMRGFHYYEQLTPELAENLGVWIAGWYTVAPMVRYFIGVQE